MNNFVQGLGHTVIAALVIAAAVVLAVSGDITGATAAGMILVVSGFTMGGSVASGSISTAASAVSNVSG